MSPEAVLRILKEGLLLILTVSAIPMLTGHDRGPGGERAAGDTQIQEQTLSFVPKLLAICLALAIAGPWMLMQTMRFTSTIFESIALVR